MSAYEVERWPEAHILDASVSTSREVCSRNLKSVSFRQRRVVVSQLSKLPNV